MLALKRYSLIVGLGLFTGLLGGFASAYRVEISVKSTPEKIHHRYAYRYAEEARPAENSVPTPGASRSGAGQRQV